MTIERCSNLQRHLRSSFAIMIFLWYRPLVCFSAENGVEIDSFKVKSGGKKFYRIDPRLNDDVTVVLIDLQTSENVGPGQSVTKIVLLHHSGRFVEQKLVLSSSFRCDQSHICHCYDLGHTLLCYFSQTWMFNISALAMVEIFINSSAICKY